MIKKQPNMNAGAAILFVIFSLLFFVLIFHYYSIQISGEADGRKLAALAQEKYSNIGTLTASRGMIYDGSGGIIAEDTDSYKLVAILDKKMTTDPKHPMYVVNPGQTAAELSKYIHLSESQIYQLLTEKGKFQVEFGKAGQDVDLNTKQAIEKLHLPGITFIRNTKRYYPNGVFASHLVGYADQIEQKDGSYQMVGEMGIEKEFNSLLSGTNGKIDYQTDMWGYLLPGKKPKVTPAKDGNDVYLTIDPKIQTFVEDAMNTVYQKYKPSMMVAIVTDPKTGKILAMEQSPTFDANTRDGIQNGWDNMAISDSYEPGSTMKVFTLSAAVNENVFNPNETYVSGSYKVTPDSLPIHDWNPAGWGRITFLEGLERSSNVAFATIANEKLGFAKFREYLSRFGFDKPTGIDLPDEVSGKIAFNYPIEKATTAFGQGTAITPIQQIQAATAVANDGNMMKPQVVEKIVNHDTGKIVKQMKPEMVGNPISADTAKKVRSLLETVVTGKYGTGHLENIGGYAVAGKTGTAQVPGPNGQYLTGPSNYVFSFLGMAPADHPRLLVYVAVEQPQGLEVYSQGSIPVSMIFNPVMKNSLQYLNVQPSKVNTPTINQVIDYTGQPATDAVKQLTNNGFDTVVVGKGKQVVSQLPDAGTTILDGEKVILKTDGNMTMPDMTGWSLRDVLKLAKLANLTLNTSGSGYAVNQSIKPGAALHDGDRLTVGFQSPELLRYNVLPGKAYGTGSKNKGS